MAQINALSLLLLLASIPLINTTSLLTTPLRTQPRSYFTPRVGRLILRGTGIRSSISNYLL